MKKVFAIILMALAITALFISCDNKPKHEHSYSTEWKYDDTNHWHECYCGEKIDEGAHVYGEWRASEESGKVERTCEVCEYVEKTDGTLVADVKALTEAYSNNAKAIYLGSDMTLSEALTISKSLALDLNGKTLTLAVSTSAANKGAVELTAAEGNSDSFTFIIKNGKIAGKLTGSKTNTITVNSHAILIIDDVDMDVECFRGIQIYQYTNPAELNIKNSSIKVNNGAYAVSTEASASQGDASKNVIITIENSTLETVGTDQDNTALLANVSSEVTIIDSVLKGNRQGAILRGTGADTVTIKNSTIEATGDGKGSYTDRTTTWASGNEVGLAALVIGNSSSTDSSYPRATTAILDGVTLKTATGYAGKHIWVTQGGNDHKVTVSGTVNVEEGVTITHNDDLNSADVSKLTCNGKAIWSTES